MGITRIPTPGFNKRTNAPKPTNNRYINVNYGGLNYCVVRDPSNGFVLPNCTGYCWGRALETTKSTRVDLSNNQGSVWFSQNKQKWDNGTGGYPYIDFINKEVSLPGGVKQSGLSTSDMLKLMTIFVMPGNIICYGEGFSPSTGYTYDENGHVQTIEELWADVDAADRFKFNNLIGTIVGSITLGAATAYLSSLLVGAVKPLIIKFVQWLIPTPKLMNFLAIAKNLGLEAARKYLSGTPLLEIAKTLTDAELINLINTLDYFYSNTGSTLVFALSVLLGVIVGGATLSQLLQGMELVYSPVFKVSESFYSGNTADHAAWETNFVNLQSEISSLSPVVQGIIMVPPKLDKINNTKHNFPWETISEYY